MSTYIVNYSVVVNDDNRSPVLRNIQKPQLMRTQVRARILLLHKLFYKDRVDVDTKIHLLMEKINSLPVGTFFSIGSLVRCADRSLAIYLGKEMSARCYPGSTYEFMSMYSGKWIYRRTKVQPELVNDFEIDLLAILNPKPPKEEP